MTNPRKKNPNDLVKESPIPYAGDPVLPVARPAAPNHPGGRPRLFDGPTVRLNLFVPEDTAKRIRHMAVDQGVSPSQLVDAWARRAELDSAVARGLKDFQEGNILDNKEVMRKLSKWG